MLCEVQKSLDWQGCNCFRKHKHQMSRELKRVPCTEANRVPGSYFTVLTYWQNSRAGGSDAPAYAIDLQLVKRDLHDGPAWVNIALCQPAACMAAIPSCRGGPISMTAHNSPLGFQYCQKPANGSLEWDWVCSASGCLFATPLHV